MTNSSCPPEKLKGKENPDLPSVCSNYWPPNVALSLCFNHLVFSTFRQSRFAIPKRSAKPIASIYHTVQCSALGETPTLIDYVHYFNVIAYGKLKLMSGLKDLILIRYVGANRFEYHKRLTKMWIL